MIRSYLSALLLLAATAGVAAPLKTIRSCNLSDGSKVMLQAETTVEGKRLYLTLNGKTERAFVDMPKTDLVGEVALAKCVDGALIFALQYGSPYLKGSAIRRNPVDGAMERLDFAEKALPRWFYGNATEMRVVIPNVGNESPSKYLIYTFIAGRGQSSEPTGEDVLPDKQGFTVHRVPVPRP